MLLCWGGRGDNDDNNDNLRGDDDVHDVQPHQPNAQKPAIVGGGGVGGKKDDDEEEYNGCWRMMGEVALAPAKRSGGAMMTTMHRALHLVEKEHHQQCRGPNRGKDNKDDARQCTPSWEE
jgi:hypothetical protein